MKKIAGILATFGCIIVITAHAQNTGQSSPDFQEQLQRLQSAVSQARQTSTPAGATPAFNQSPQAVAAATGISPPVSPTAGLAGATGAQVAPPSLAATIPGASPPIAANAANATPPNPDQVAVPGVNGGASAMEGVNLRDQAFSETTDNLLPLTPDQIRTLHHLFSGTQRAVSEAPGIPPRPTSSSKIVNLSPGATPPIIRLSAGFVSSLVFLDSSGSPWPVASYDLGDPKSYNVQWDKKSNMLLIQAITEYKSGNLAVMLCGLNTPVMVTLLPGQRAVDYRVDLRIPGMGPNATPPSMPELIPGASNPILLEVLNGIPPQGSRALKVAGRDCTVWLWNNKLYVRTRLTVLSPGWISTLSSADGMHAYEMQPTPVILASENGKMVKLTIQGL
jgi:intracellular multiplication protein IcmK